MPINLRGKRTTALETTSQVPTRKRGGAKHAPIHMILLIVCTLLLTLSGVFFIIHSNLIGIVLLIAGLVVRFIDTRV